MSRRRLEVGADGMANVLLLRNPIPRHLSLVAWGANDVPAVSWKRAGMDASQVLREPPTAADISMVDMRGASSFISETLDAWRVTIADVLRTPLSPEERGARVRALTLQAGARISAYAHAATAASLSAVSASYKTVGLKLPEPPDASTLDGELDRRRFMSGVEQASGALSDRVLSMMRDSSLDDGSMSLTEAILASFGGAANVFDRWALSMPAGVVGVHQPDASIKNSPENPMTIEDLQRLAQENPVAFLTAFKSALEAVQKSAPDVAKKFMWGDTGVTQESPEAILAMLNDLSSGAAFQGIIASAVGSIDLNAVATGDSPQVAATMRAGLGKILAHELATNPTGELAASIKASVAESVAKAVSGALEAVLAGTGNNDPANSGGFDFGFKADEEDNDPLKVYLPGQSR